MHVVIEARGIGNVANEEEKQYLLALLKYFISCHSHHSFTLITEAKQSFSGANVTSYIQPPVNGYMGLWRWYNRRLPAIIQEVKAQRLMIFNGCPAKSAVPQVVFVSSPMALQQAGSGSFSFLYRKYLAAQLRKHPAIATINARQQLQTAKWLGITRERILPVGYAVPAIFQPVDWQQREQILQTQTGGREYFVYTGSFSEAHFLLVLKAFSLFKKRQQSSLQLVAAGHFTISTTLQEMLDTYKFRADVMLYPNAAEATMASWITGAYAMIFVDEQATPFSVAAAMQCGIPVILFEENKGGHEVAGYAALYAHTTPESLAEQMKLIYKDENRRQQLVAYTQVQAAVVSGTGAAQKLWESLESIAEKNPPTFTA